MTLALTTIVIPTTGERASVETAISSALACARSVADVQVIVVANGRDAEATVARLRRRFGDAIEVRASPPGACSARNAGLAAAAGEFVRFLDDDDVLSAPGFIAQVDLASRCHADVCSAPIHVAGDAGSPVGLAAQPDTPDYIAAALSPERMVQCTAHLFRAERVRGHPWNPALPYSQDIDWALSLGRSGGIRWVKTDIPCGTWHRHTGRRISTAAPISARKRLVAAAILDLVGTLESQGRLTLHRREAAAAGLWECVHASLAYEPRFWAGIAARATQLHPGSAPRGRVHRSFVSALGVGPLAIEALLVPKRLSGRVADRIGLALGLRSHW